MAASDLGDWHEVHEAVADAYFPHTLRPLAARATPNAFVDYVDLGTCRITRMALGGEVSVVSDHPGAYGINIPVAGELTCVIEGSTVASCAGQATVCPPDARTLIPHWKPSCELIGFKIDNDFIRREVEQVLGRRAHALPSQIDLRSATGRAWFGFLRSVYGRCARMKGRC